MTLKTSVCTTLFQNAGLANIFAKTSNPTNSGSARLPGRPVRVESTTAVTVGQMRRSRMSTIVGRRKQAAAIRSRRRVPPRLLRARAGAVAEVAARSVRSSCVAEVMVSPGGRCRGAPAPAGVYLRYLAQASSSWLDAEARADLASVPLMMSSKVLVMMSSNST